MSELGKFPFDLIERLIYPKMGAERPEVVVGPGAGRDNAVIKLSGGQVLVATADPLSVIPELGFEVSAYISLHLLASDLATCGFAPQFFMANLNLPPQMSDDDFAKYWSTIDAECRKLDVAIVGGHTGRYEGSGYTVIGGGVMFSVVPQDRYVASTMAKPDDVIMMTKGVAIATTGILSRVFPQTVRKAYGTDFLKHAQRYLHSFSVVEDALISAHVGLRDEGVTSMHDVTEGGLLGALYELSEASNVGVEIDLSKVIVTEEAQRICQLFEISPYTSLSEGTLLLTVKPEMASAVRQALDLKGTRNAVIGKVIDANLGRWVLTEGKREPLQKPGADPYWAAYWKAYREGWK